MKNIICIVGPSGSSKDSVALYSLKSVGYLDIVSHTTRAPRIGEVDGVNYHYVTKEVFDKLRKVESVCYSGNYYCVAKDEIEAKFKKSNNLAVVVSIEGAEALKAEYGDIVKTVFMNIDRDVCIQRMVLRGDSEESIQARIKNYDESKEFENGPRCDYIYNCPTDMSIEDNRKDFLKFIENLKEVV